MKREEIINFLTEKFPPSKAFEGDSIGLQVEGTASVKKILLTLDINMEIIMEAITNEVDLIISHHPLFFGEKVTLLQTNPLLKAKYELLLKNKINVFVIHTNIDFHPKGLAYHQAKQMKMTKIKSIINDEAIIANWNKDFDHLQQLIDFIKDKLALKHHFRTNISNNVKFNKAIIASGASGDLIYNSLILGNLFVVGELKWHHWVYAKEMGINVIEIGHFSEIIFKTALAKSLTSLSSNLNIIQSEEQNEYFEI